MTSLSPTLYASLYYAAFMNITCFIPNKLPEAPFKLAESIVLNFT